jgi:hypothetical protein
MLGLEKHGTQISIPKAADIAVKIGDTDTMARIMLLAGRIPNYY